MRTTRILTFAFISALFTPAVQQAYGAVETIDGVVSDSMCVKKHMMPGRSDAECIKECVKSGSSYVLVSGDKVYTLSGKPQSIAPFAGKQVHVQGDLKQNTISVTSIRYAKTEMPHNMPM